MSDEACLDEPELVRLFAEVAASARPRTARLSEGAARRGSALRLRRRAAQAGSAASVLALAGVVVATVAAGSSPGDARGGVPAGAGTTLSSSVSRAVPPPGRATRLLDRTVALLPGAGEVSARQVSDDPPGPSASFRYDDGHGVAWLQVGADDTRVAVGTCRPGNSLDRPGESATCTPLPGGAQEWINKLPVSGDFDTRHLQTWDVELVAADGRTIYLTETNSTSETAPATRLTQPFSTGQLFAVLEQLGATQW